MINSYLILFFIIKGYKRSKRKLRFKLHLTLLVCLNFFLYLRPTEHWVSQGCVLRSLMPTPLKHNCVPPLE